MLWSSEEKKAIFKYLGDALKQKRVPGKLGWNVRGASRKANLPLIIETGLDRSKKLTEKGKKS